MYILRCHIFQINIINLRAVFHIIRHSGNCRDIGYLKSRIRCKRYGIGRCSMKGSSGCMPLPFPVDLPDALNHFKQSRPSRDAITFKRGRYCKADRLLRPPGVCNHKIRRKRIQSPLLTFHGGIKGFQINCNINFVFHLKPPCFYFLIFSE